MGQVGLAIWWGMVVGRGAPWGHVQSVGLGRQARPTAGAVRTRTFDPSPERRLRSSGLTKFGTLSSGLGDYSVRFARDNGSSRGTSP